MLTLMVLLRGWAGDRYRGALFSASNVPRKVKIRCFRKQLRYTVRVDRVEHILLYTNFSTHTHTTRNDVSPISWVWKVVRTVAAPPSIVIK